MQVITKTAAVVDAGGDGPGEFHVILSAPTKDRDNETVRTGAFDPLPPRLGFDVDHGLSVRATVGSGVPSYGDDGRLHVHGTWASTQLAQDTRTLVKEGHITSVSVAFMNAVRAKDNRNEIVKAELLNGSFVAVPANPDARILSAKAGRRNSRSDQDLIQAIYEAVVALGAAPPEPEDEPVDGGVEHVGAKAVSDKPWSDFTASDYTVEQWRRACLIGPAGGSSDSKSDYKLPVREPSGTLNRAGVHAAAAALAGARGGVQASDEQKRTAARALVRLYGQLDEDPPESLRSMAGKSFRVLVATDYTIDSKGRVSSAAAGVVDIVDHEVPESDETPSGGSEPAAAVAVDDTAAVKAAAEQQQHAALARIRRRRAMVGASASTTT